LPQSLLAQLSSERRRQRQIRRKQIREHIKWVLNNTPGNRKGTLATAQSAAREGASLGQGLWHHEHMSKAAQRASVALRLVRLSSGPLATARSALRSWRPCHDCEAAVSAHHFCAAMVAKGPLLRCTSHNTTLALGVTLFIPVLVMPQTLARACSFPCSALRCGQRAFSICPRCC